MAVVVVGVRECGRGEVFLKLIASFVVVVRSVSKLCFTNS